MMLSTIIKVGSKLASACNYSFRRSLGLKIRPYVINFIVTYRCNSRCIMCNIWQRYQDNPALSKSELSLDDIQTFLKCNKDFLQNTGFGITGGEPFLREDLVNIARLISKSAGRDVIGIQTNGLISAKIIKDLTQIKLLFNNIGVGISLDGLGQLHDEARGISGAFEKTIATIKGVRDLGLRVSVGMTLNPKNCDRILAVRDYLKKFNVDFTAFLPDQSYYFANQGQNYSLTKEELNLIAEQLKSFAYHYYMDNLRLRLSSKKKRTLSCWSGHTSIVIDPYGNVFPCILRNDCFGNIKEQSLEKLLFSPKAAKIRNSLKGCSCWSQCEVSHSAVTSPFDVIRWFLFECNDKKGFLKDLNKKRANLG